MAGFSSNDQIISALANGQTYRANWSKNFNPTAAAVANEWHTLFRGAGNPGADALFNTDPSVSRGMANHILGPPLAIEDLC